MQQAATPLAAPDAPYGVRALSELAERVRPLEPVPRQGLLRNESAILLDRLLTRVARSRGALDVAVGERLSALTVGDRLLQLGCSGIGDYGRERLGMNGRTAQELSHLARALQDRPRLAAAVRAGEVSARKAEVLLPVARGEAEAGWVARARSETVRALKLAVKEAPESAAPAEEDERWDWVFVSLDDPQRATFDEAMTLAGRVLGAAAPAWQRLEALCSEYLGSHPAGLSEAEGSAGDGPLRCHLEPSWLPAAKQALEEETRRWAFLDALSPVPPVPAPGAEPPAAPRSLDAELRELVALRDGWDEVMGHLAMLLQFYGLWRDAKFATFDQYCAERLGLSTRAVQQRAWLARRCYDLPGLREAMREKRLSYEQARLVAGCADASTVAGWIARAEGMTCIELRRAIDADAKAQMCARRSLDTRVPVRVANLMSAAFRAAREGADHWLHAGECLAKVAQHFIDTWKDAVGRPRTPQAKAIARDGGFCQAPGCSRAALQAHHIRFRSAGGTDELSNLTPLCAAHHLIGVHRGYLRVTGQAPDRLRWEVRPS